MQAADSKKEEFQKYLEKSGVIDQLTKVLVGLYEVPEKPANAIDFIKEYLGSAQAAAGAAGGSAEEARLRGVIADQDRQIKDKDEQIAHLKKQLEELKLKDSK